MVVGVCRIELHVPGPHSLKEKRHVLKGLRDRMRRDFNVSVAEVGDHDMWQRARIAVACVGTETAYVNGVLDRLLQMVSRQDDVEIVRSQLEFV